MEIVRAFLSMITKKNRPKKTWVDKGTEFAAEFKKIAKLKENKVTLQRVRPRLHLLNVEYNPWKTYFIVTCKTITSTITTWLISLQHQNLEEIAR